MATNIVGLKELRENLDDYLAAVQNGKSFIVIKRSKPVMKISSPDDEETWERVADFTSIGRNGVPAAKILRELRKLDARS